MTLAQILKEKKELSNKIKKEYKLPIKNKAFGLILVENKNILQKLYFGLANLPIDFIIVWDFWKEWRDEQFNNIYVTKKIDNNSLRAFDFVVLDENTAEISKYNENAITPICLKGNQLSAILKEYQPMKNEWNSYIYEENNEWSIFWAISRYFENYKITFDNKNLLKNVYGG